jgi:hypothetical protein
VAVRQRQGRRALGSGHYRPAGETLIHLRAAVGLSLGLRNVDTAIETARKLSAVSTIKCLVLETDEWRKSLPRDLRAELGDWHEVWLWDAAWTDIVLTAWPGSLPWPFFRKISYGGNVNHLLVALALIERRCLIRFDPGTWPLEDPARSAARHDDDLAAGHIFSGQYTDRIALRHDFIAEGRQEDYYELIENRIGVNPRKGQQITGGASLLRPADTKPDIVFDGVMAWASDDGFLRRYYGDDATVDASLIVGRNSPGYPHACDAYVQRLVNAVVLRNRHDGNPDREKILDAVRAFLAELRFLVQRERVGDIDRVTPESTPVDAILAGYDNYIRLTAEWPAVVAEATRRLRAASVSELQ